MLNRFEFIGNLTKDIELRKTESGKFVTNLDIALNYYVQNEKKTEYVQVAVWEKQAEDAANFLSKGRQVYVEGKVTIRKRTVEGKNIPIPEFHADRVLYLGSSNNRSDGNGQQANHGYQGNIDNHGNQSNQGYQGQQHNPFGNPNAGAFNQSSNYNRNQNQHSPFGR